MNDKTKSRTLLVKARSILESAASPGPPRNESYDRLAHCYLRLGDKIEFMNCEKKALADMRLPKATAAQFLWMPYISTLELLRIHGFGKEADVEFERLLQENYSGGYIPDIGVYLHWACCMEGYPPRALYYADRVIDIRKKQGAQAEVLGAMESKYIILYKLGKVDEALELMISAAKSKLSKTPEDWARQANNVWISTLLLISRGKLNDAIRINDDFKPPENCLGQTASRLSDLCKLAIAADEGKEAVFEALKKKMILGGETDEEGQKFTRWLQLLNADLLLVQNRHKEAWKILAQPDLTKDLDAFLSGQYLLMLKAKMRRALAIEARTH